MKKITCLLILLLSMFSLTSCNEVEKIVEIPGKVIENKIEIPGETIENKIEIPGKEIENVHPLPELPNDEEESLTMSKDSVKILAIGNSFSDNAFNQMYSILKAFGANEIVLGNMYIGGCTVETHYNNAKNDSASYTYRKNDSRTASAGTFINTNNTKISTALTDEDWQVVTFQQASHDSGVIDTYSTTQLDYLTALAKNTINNDNLKVGWHMTWAYQANSTHNAFPKYNNDQMTMYEVINACVVNKIETNDNFDFVIPAGTAIQNARTSYLGDTLTADGYHLNALGEYIIGLTWVLKYTGWDIEDLNLDYVPNQFKKHIDVIKESAVNALAKPHEVTESQYKEVPNAGLDLSKHELLEFETAIGYWNSTDAARSTIFITDQKKYIGNTVRFSKETLPVGSLIVVADGWQYRPDGWTTETGNTAGRPAETNESVITVDEAWWGNYIYRAFNISKVGKPDLTNEDLANIGNVFKIYVPKKAQSGEGEYADYYELDWQPQVGYWFSQDSGERAYTFNTSQKIYISSGVRFSKEDIPVGSIIVLAEGYQYRPDGWTTETENTASRPGETKEAVVHVDEAWWGNFVYRGFNVSKVGKPALTEDDFDDFREAFKIYVPKN